MRLLRCPLLLVLGLIAISLPGCVAVPISASNPVPSLTTVAVVPFFNLSAERTVDGRRFAIAYFAELQKTPGFQVIPVGVVEQAIQENELSMDSPTDVMRLAEMLKADAVVVGAVTEYDPYYPPKLGMQVQWYSPRRWAFYPGVPECPPAGLQTTGPVVLRGQSPNDEILMEDEDPADLPRLSPLAQNELNAGSPDTLGPLDDAPQPLLPEPLQGTPQLPPSGPRFPQVPPAATVGKPLPGPDSPITEPLMAYTRFFDGADPRLTHELKRYAAWRSDRRSGDWEAHLHRSDDFIQFCSHLMVLEMLQIHGAAVATEYVPFWKSL